MKEILALLMGLVPHVDAQALPGHFLQDITSQTSLPKIASTSINVGDINGDGKPDIVLAGRLFQNISTNQEIRFKEVTREMGLSEPLSGFPILLDINNDGSLDIVTTERKVYLQINNKFVDVSQNFGDPIPENTYSISFADINGDGYADLLIGPSEITDNNQFNFRPIQIMLNKNGKGFFNATKLFQSDRFLAYVRGFAWADYDNTGSAKAYFSNYRLRPNFLFKFDKSGITDQAVEKGVEGIYNQNMFYDHYRNAMVGYNYGHTLGSTWADLDNDGNFDLWVSNLAHKFVSASDVRGYLCDDSKIYRNTGAPDYKFIDMRAESEIPFKPIGDVGVYEGDELWTHVTSGDFDNDGNIDLYVTQVYNLPYAYSFLLKNKGHFKFEDIGAAEQTRVIDSYAGAWVDFNGDGLLDLVTSGRSRVDAEPEIHIMKNVTQSAYHFLKVKLIGKKSGRNPVTTQVRLFHSQGLFLRQYEGVTGSLNQQNDSVLHFGLGNVAQIQKLEVRWNSGKVQVLNNVLPDQTLTIVEPD
jgi:hypothetical protein